MSNDERELRELQDPEQWDWDAALKAAAEVAPLMAGDAGLGDAAAAEGDHRAAVGAHARALERSPEDAQLRQAWLAQRSAVQRTIPSGAVEKLMERQPGESLTDYEARLEDLAALDMIPRGPGGVLIKQAVERERRTEAEGEGIQPRTS